ncbi:uncharacterized protein LOC141529390 [Cotesia typhae]|uniref:uncharacterized protein LOC141529390 n=1 Tax=Cotesia typhae TaxID=2053667 RepID=UPI003D69F9B5
MSSEIKKLKKHVLIKYKTSSGIEKFKVVYKQSIHHREENDDMLPITDLDTWDSNLLYSINGEKMVGPITILDDDESLQELRERNNHLTDKRIPADKRYSMTPLGNKENKKEK